MKIEVGKYYKTRAGNKVRIYVTDGGIKYPIHGAILREDDWHTECWTSYGYYRKDNVGSVSDIISEWKEPLDFDPSCLPEWAEWVAMDVDGTWYWYRDDPRPRGTVCHVGDHCTPIPEKYAPKNYTGDWKDSLRKVSDLKNHES